MKRRLIPVFAVLFVAIIAIASFILGSLSRTPTEVSKTPVTSEIVSPSPALSLTPAPTSGSEPTISPQNKVSEVKIFMVALEDNGKAGKKIGCGDSIVPVVRKITPTLAPLSAAFDELLSIKTRTFGQSGFYNSLYQSNLSLVNASVDSKRKAAVNLSGTIALGGTCDNPRFKSQLEETALQFPTVKSVSILINGKTLDEILSLR